LEFTKNSQGDTRAQDSKSCVLAKILGSVAMLLLGTFLASFLPALQERTSEHDDILYRLRNPLAERA
jgi:hypothetical protein